jgi:hypothetical protein
VSTVGALFYADVRSAINQLREIRRSPLRALLWGAFAVFVAGFIVLRIVRAIQHTRLPLNIMPPVESTDAIVCGAMVYFGFSLAFGGRLAGLFANAAEARFIIASPATPFVATLYVQTRELLLRSSQRGLGVLYAGLFYLPERLGPGTLARDIVLLVAGFIAISAVPLARQLLLRPVERLAVACGLACIAGGVLPLLRDAAVAFGNSTQLGNALLALPAWHPGVVLRAGAGAQWAALAILIASTVVLIALVARAAQDAYPELYELSMRRLARTERLRNRIFASAAAPARDIRATSNSGARAPAGVAIFVWRAWTEYRRTHDARSTGLEAASLLIGGYAIARLSAAADSEAVVAVASSLANVLFILALARSAALGPELRKTLFWLAAPTLFERLGALAVAQSWRMIGWFVLFAIGLAVGRAPVPAVLGAAVAGPAIGLFAIATGYASYGLLPNDADQRGPLLFVRWVLGYVLVAPAVTAGIAIDIVLHEATTAIAAGSITALTEAALLITFAAWRLDRMSVLVR